MYSIDIQIMVKSIMGKKLSTRALFSVLVFSILLLGSMSGMGKAEVASGEKGFALDMYSELRGNEGNIFISPWSIYSALAMTYEGARGQTESEMRSVMHLSGNNSTRRQSFAALYDRLNINSGYNLSTANALWVQNGFPLLGEYTDLINRFYHGKAENIDLAGSPERSAWIINSWVAEKTGYKIKDLISPDSLGNSTRLVLTNAVYFKGAWANEFDKNATHNGSFRTGDGRTIDLQMMERTGYYAYMEAEDFQILRMPYKGDNISMIVILPKRDDGISSLERSLSKEALMQWGDALDAESQGLKKVDVTMPRFSLDAKYFLSNSLSNMGMKLAFSDKADFSGMDGRKDLLISDVVHRAFIDVNEEGTEAAASTAVFATTLSIEPPVPAFIADHPFLFLIQDRESGIILFMGRVSDPGNE